MAEKSWSTWCPSPERGPGGDGRNSGAAGAGEAAGAAGAAGTAPAGPDLRPHLGGGPFNVAIAAGRQGAEVAFLSRVSTDAYGRAELERLEGAGVDVGLVQRGGEPTALAVTLIDADGSATYDFHWAGSADRLVADPGPIDADVVCLGTCSLVFEPGASVYETILFREAARGRVVALDPNVRPAIISDPARYRERFRSWLPHVSAEALRCGSGVALRRPAPRRRPCRRPHCPRRPVRCVAGRRRPRMGPGTVGPDPRPCGPAAAITVFRPGANPPAAAELG